MEVIWHCLCAGDQVKQADTILLQFPLMWEMNSSTQKNDAEIYEKVSHIYNISGE